MRPIRILSLGEIFLASAAVCHEGRIVVFEARTRMEAPATSADADASLMKSRLEVSLDFFIVVLTEPCYFGTLIASGSQVYTRLLKKLSLVTSAGPAALSPNTGSSTTGLRVRTALKKFKKWSYRASYLRPGS